MNLILLNKHTGEQARGPRGERLEATTLSEAESLLAFTDPSEIVIVYEETGREVTDAERRMASAPGFHSFLSDAERLELALAPDAATVFCGREVKSHG